MSELLATREVVDIARWLFNQTAHYLLDLGVFSYVFLMRERTNLEGMVVEVSLRKLACASGLREGTVKASLLRLEDMGLITVLSRGWCNVRRYRIVTKEDWCELEKRQTALKKTPACVENLPCLPLLWFDFIEGRVKLSQVEVSKVVAMSVCPKCGFHYDQTIGAGADGLCVNCWIQREWAAGEREFNLFGKIYKPDRLEDLLCDKLEGGA